MTTICNTQFVEFENPTKYNESFFTYETELAVFLAVLENFVLPMGRDSSHETLLVMSVVYKRYLRAVTKKSERR